MLTSDTQPSAERKKIKFRLLPGQYVIIRLSPGASVPDWATRGDFHSITRTNEELSIICRSDNLIDLQSKARWICLKLQGPFPFSQTGVLLSFIKPLSSNGVPIFAISTYDTDYVLVQEEFAEQALSTLQRAGHEFLPWDDSSSSEE